MKKKRSKPERLQNMLVCSFDAQPVAVKYEEVAAFSMYKVVFYVFEGVKFHWGDFIEPSQNSSAHSIKC